MMKAVQRTYRSAVVDLLEQPNVIGPVDVVVASSTMNATAATAQGFVELPPASIAQTAPPLDDFDPLVPAQPIRLSDLVLEDRR